MISNRPTISAWPISFLDNKWKWSMATKRIFWSHRFAPKLLKKIRPAKCWLRQWVHWIFKVDHRPHLLDGTLSTRFILQILPHQDDLLQVRIRVLEWKVCLLPLSFVHDWSIGLFWSLDNGETRDCVVCMETECQVACMPCGHFSTCVPCGHSLRSCPICRAAVKSLVRIYQ